MMEIEDLLFENEQNVSEMRRSATFKILCRDMENIEDGWSRWRRVCRLQAPRGLYRYSTDRKTIMRDLQ